jgi:carbon monoxide dehydrogenase subunit G
MLVEDSFQVRLAVDDAWTLLTDLERVVPCVPGASLDEVVDGEYRGRVTARIGPITVNYVGAARFEERDEVEHRAVVSLRGREERGGGSVSATMTTALHAEGERTMVELATELDVSGRAAQFGRGILGDVVSSVMGEFAACLERMAGAPGDGDGASAPVVGSAALDVRRTVLAPVARRAAVPAACLLLGGIAGWLLSGGRAQSRGLRRRLPQVVILPPRR